MALGVSLLTTNLASAEQSGIGSAGARGARWQKGTVSVSVEPSMDQLGDPAFEGLIHAVSAWQESPAELPTLVVARGPQDEIGYRRGGRNKNTVRFSPDGDPLANGALAITVITFDAHAREILDADIILNGEHRFGFFADAHEQGKTNVYDMQNVLTHELGHLLGLGEDYDDEYATMYAFSQPGEIIKRDLEAADTDAIIQLYIEPLPEDSAAGCGGATIAAQNSEGWLWTAVALFGLGGLMRRRSARAAASALSVLGALIIGMSGSSSLPSSGLLAAEAASGIPAALSQANVIPTLVMATNSHWEGGLIVTQLSLKTEPQGETTPAREFTVEALGGQVGDLVQQVGHVFPPQVGDVLSLRGEPGTGSRLILPVARPLPHAVPQP